MTRFKSYYVVWKQIWVFCYFKIFELFKSYYVVWKLKYINKNKYEKESLNRTMQYGNFKTISILNAHTEVFKSYYVVWKPKKENMGSGKQAGFKSYYVVWKLVVRCCSKIVCGV